MLFTGEAAQANVPHMYYENFSKHITSKWQVVLEGWPFTKFISLSSLVTKNEVEILFNAWKTGTAKFCRLSDVEWQSWDNACFQDMLDINVHDVEDNMDDIVVENRILATDNTTSAPTLPTNSAPTPSTNSAPTPSTKSAPTPPTSSAPLLLASPSNLINIPLSSASAAHGTSFIVNMAGDTGKAPRKAQCDKGQAHKPCSELASVTTVEATRIKVLKKPHKSCSDKGLKRGMRKDKENA